MCAKILRDVQEQAAQLHSQATGLKGLLAARKQRAAELQSEYKSASVSFAHCCTAQQLPIKLLHVPL